MSMEVPFSELDHSDLVIDCIYRGGTAKNLSAEPFHKLIPGCENSGGFRKKLREDGSGKYAYIVLYTSMEELEWPDFLEEETGIFRYYGDNRSPGRNLTDTHKKGNKILEMTFDLLNSGTSLEDMPPFFIFKKTGHGRDIQFLGLAAPGNPKISPDKDLVAFWRTLNGQRFQNYEAYFTVLDTGKQPVSRKWIESLIYDHENNLQYAPDAWKKFLREGRNGISALRSPRIVKVPNRYEQLQCDQESEQCLEEKKDQLIAERTQNACSKKYISGSFERKNCRENNSRRIRKKRFLFKGGKNLLHPYFRSVLPAGFRNTDPGELPFR